MGPQYLVDWARKFGIGQQTGIDLPAESAGHLPSPETAHFSGQKSGTWKPSNTLDLAIGQSSLGVTPLQMARVMAAVANDGSLVVPHLAANTGPISPSESESIRNTLPLVESRPISGLHPSTLDYVREGLTMVVNHPSGTGYKTVRMKQVTIAGKTGTAETNGVDHAWFAGYVPAERPRIAFVVVLEHGGGGGKSAGPVAHEFVKALLERGLIEKTTEVASDHR
jgi:penicillin-binding protein 2